MGTLRRPAVAFIVWSVASLAALTDVSAPRAPAAWTGHRFAAIAYSETTGRHGYAVGWSLQEAMVGAMAHCYAPDAHVVVWVEDGWAALAMGDNGVYAVGCSHRSLADAEMVALQGCAVYNYRGAILAWVYSG